jgi:SAM-dependent methyltransferase
VIALKEDDMTLMRTAVGLGSSLEALAALAAHIRVTGEGIDVDPRLRALLAEVAHELLGDGEADTAGPAAAAAVGMTRALLGQARDLVEDPGRTGGWVADDNRLVQSMGRQSMSIVEAFGVAARTLDGLDAALAAPGARFLDVGTGSGWLAIALARAHPNLNVVGLDVLTSPLALARRNVADTGLDGQVELRLQDVTTLEEDASYDAVWLPLPFLPGAIVPAAMDAARRTLRPGGWLLAGTFAGPTGGPLAGPGTNADRLGRLLVDVRTVRSGGHPWTPAELVELIAGHGFDAAAELPRTWSAPVGLWVGRRPQ